ncbi:4Fe-4S dicluster domain-containing protein [Marimonas arenosa]|uniref:4Fe-4S dicluster domain-containing protein n=1 Tax=Marimonas arenosa TaxID=1795305 RepID=A0AAE3WFT7_9RHOB|nr:4Fe-4S dicluster domain-containing protein [Marimonas arenosa]MDQ2090902.1 4Fe-4S dicluster domain-containing protein [Marimonas arenosa]
MKRNPHRPFTPRPEQMALHPGLSGNDINGLGERAFRRPEVVYWAKDPDDIPHGAVQRWFYTANPPSEVMQDARAGRQVILDAPLPEVTGAPAARAPGDWTAGLASFVEAGVCEMTGVAEMDPAWLFEGAEVAQSRLIVLGVQHDYAGIARAPEVEAGAEVIRQYGRAAGAAKAVAGWIRAQGWEAEPVTGPMAGEITLIPPAIACGFGELGKHGSIINPELGASFRLSGVLTDAPFALTPRRAFGIDAFCMACRVCEDACPPEAIAPDKQWVRGVEKWYVDFDRCLPYFNETHGCGICIAVCPWSRPGVGLSLAAKLARRAARKDG